MVVQQPVPTALLGKDGRVVEVGEALADLLGVAVEELLGSDFGSWVVEEDRELVAADVERVGAGERLEERAVRRLQRRDGVKVWCEVLLVEFKESTEQFLIVVQLLDLGPCVAEEEEDLLRFGRWRGVIEESGLGIYDYDGLSGTVYFSAGYTGNLGYAPREWAAHVTEWSERIHPDDFDRVMEVTRQLMERRGEGFSIEYRLRHRDGGYRWVLDRSRVVEWGGEGNQTRVVGTHLDITDRKVMEERLGRGWDSLAMVVDNMPCPVVVLPVGAGGGVALVNRVFREVVGCGVGELGSVEDLVGLLAGGGVERGGIREWLEGVQVGDGGVVREFRLRALDGGERRISLRGAVVGGLLVLAGFDVTERMRVADTLARAYHKMRLAADAAGIGFWEYDVATDREHWDAMMFRIYGLQPEEFRWSGDGWQRLLHPEDRGRVIGAIRQVWESGAMDIREEFRIIRPDGALRHVLSMAAVSRDGEGRPVVMTGVNQDVTERKLAEESLRREEEAIRRIVEYLPIPVMVISVGVGEGPVMLNRRFVEGFGYRPVDVPTFERWMELAFPDVGYRKEVLAWWGASRLRALEGDGVVEGRDLRMVAADGGWREVILSAALVGSSVVLTLQDVTERKRAQEELEAARDALEKRALELTHHIPVGTFVVQGGEDGWGVSFTSDRLLEMLELRREEVRADGDLLERLLHPEDAGSFYARCRSVAGTLDFFSWDGRFWVGGELRWFRVEANPRQVADGGRLWEGVVTDLTLRKLAEAALARALAAEQSLRSEAEAAREVAERATRAKSLFLAGISHEIRTPLSALVALSRAMWEESTQRDVPRGFGEFLNRIRTGGQYLDLLLTNLLDISAIEAGTPPVAAESFYVGDWQDDIDSILSPIAANRGVVLEWEVSGGGDDQFRTDPVRLAQIVLNLAHHAMKVGDVAGGGRVLIRMRVRAGGLLVEVVDGRSEADFVALEAALASVAQGGRDLADLHRGDDLGLAIVMQNSLLLGGSFRIERALPCGACFRVELPVLAGDPKGGGGANRNLAYWLAGR